MREWYLSHTRKITFKNVCTELSLTQILGYWSRPSSSTMLCLYEQQRIWRNCADAQLYLKHPLLADEKSNIFSCDGLHMLINPYPAKLNIICPENVVAAYIHEHFRLYIFMDANNIILIRLLLCDLIVRILVYLVHTRTREAEIYT